MAPPSTTPKTERASTGAVRETLYHTGDHGHPIRFDLIFTNEIGVRRLAETYGEGCVKYGPVNWKQGFPESVLVNHALEHLRLHMMGNTDEDHLAHMVWNIFTLMWVQEKKPELMDVTGLKK